MPCRALVELAATRGHHVDDLSPASPHADRLRRKLRWRTGFRRADGDSRLGSAASAPSRIHHRHRLGTCRGIDDCRPQIAPSCSPSTTSPRSSTCDSLRRHRCIGEKLPTVSMKSSRSGLICAQTSTSMAWKSSTPGRRRIPAGSMLGWKEARSSSASTRPERELMSGSRRC